MSWGASISHAIVCLPFSVMWNVIMTKHAAVLISAVPHADTTSNRSPVINCESTPMERLV